MYRQLDSSRILETAERLERRIGERFPDSGLRKVAAELVQMVRERQSLLERLDRVNLPLRIGAVATSLALVLGTVAIVVLPLRLARGESSPTDILQTIASMVNGLILLVLGVLFFVNLEARDRRKRSLAALHELRSLAHVIDMHQLTKDPESIRSRASDTRSSPVRDLTEPELRRYLDYCAEMLAIASKVAALHAQHMRDPVVLEAVRDIESLTGNLSAKIWQKLTIMDNENSGIMIGTRPAAVPTTQRAAQPGC